MAENWTKDEENSVSEFQKKLQRDLPSDQCDDKHLLYKFLKARNFNLTQADVMYKKNLKWRREFQLNTIIRDFKPSEVLQKYVSQECIGYDKQGSLIQYAAIGNVDGKGMFQSANKLDVFRCVLQEIEKNIKRLKFQSEKNGKIVNQCVYIYDMENMTLAKALHKKSIELFAQGIAMFQENYPEMLKTIYIINASIYFTMAFPIVRAILTGSIIDKIKVFGKEGWKEELLNTIDAEVLPAFLGGKRYDPDGNPKCYTFVHHAGMIPESYYLKKNINVIAKKDGVKKFTIDRRASTSIPIEVKNPGTVLNWEYEMKNYDIKFGVSMKRSQSDIDETELIPLHYTETENESDTGSYICAEPGYYSVIFDNSYSWFNSKEVYCRVWLTEQNEEKNLKDENDFIDC